MEKVPILFDIISKIPEMSIESNYSVVRIMNSWCKSFSILFSKYIKIIIYFLRVRIKYKIKLNYYARII